ncbi:hypothetical protein [Pelagibacterium sp.]|uniref:hypothetical protein n=1 Tax=Pelagibacterium sp. TaxID=1967288 RepID=UPI003A8D9160
MMGPDDRVVDHVSASITLDQFGQSFEHRLDPASISPEDAVPLAASSGRCRHCATVRAIHIMPS